MTQASFHFLTDFAYEFRGKIVASIVIKRTMTKDKTVNEEIIFEPIPPEKRDPATVLQRINDMLADFHFRRDDANNLPIIA